jgi:pilus assembly protein CpaF
MMGLGVLEPFLKTEGVEEIIVRQGAVRLWLNGSIQDTDVRAPDTYFYALAQRAAEMGGKPLRAAKPFVLIDLPDGSRFTAMVPPLSIRGTAINIRVFTHHVLSLEQLVAFETLTWEQADYLNQAMLDREKSILISGPPGSGKTTLLNSLLALLPQEAQLCGAETFEEIATNSRFEARAVVREDVESGRVSMAEVVNVLYTRMRPDVLSIGEVVGQEAREYLQAINLGIVAHSTIHGNSVLDALYRLESLARDKDISLGAIRESIARGVGIGVHLETKREPNGRSIRRVREIVEVSGDAEQYVLKPIRVG